MISSRRRSLRRSKVAPMLLLHVGVPSSLVISEAETVPKIVLTIVSAISSPESDVEVPVAYSRETGHSSR